jgi:hypothetical protein
MALLFNDPLAFLPVDSMAHSQAIGGSGGHHNGGLRMLFPNWNHSSSGGGFDPAAARSDIHPIGTFNQPQQSAIQQQRQLDQLEEIKTRMENLQKPSSFFGEEQQQQQQQQNRSLHSRRIKPHHQQQESAQMLEPIPVMDLDHPLNSWMLPNRKTEHLGPLASKNNSDWPILPRFTVSQLSNGTLVQIPVSPPSIALHLNILFLV